MNDIDEKRVDAIRLASRQIVQALGFLTPALAGTPYAASGVHLLLALAQTPGMTGQAIAGRLQLEKSTVSRLVNRLAQAGEIVQSPDGADGRLKLWSLSDQGQHTVAAIHAYGRDQVTTALAPLSLLTQQLIAHGLSAYAAALQQPVVDERRGLKPLIEVCRGYQPGLIGQVVALQAMFYAKHAGFGQVFESQLATQMAEFCQRLTLPMNDVWTVQQAGRIVGSVSIDGQDLASGQAHLRWFVMAEHLRGLGMGRRLLNEAIQFCDQLGYAEIHLWTFQGLGAARHLYEALGFELKSALSGAQWGETVLEQHFVRTVGKKA